MTVKNVLPIGNAEGWLRKIQDRLTIPGGLDPENCVEEIRCLQAEIESFMAKERASLKAPNE